MLLCWPKTPKTNVGDMVVEVAATWQEPIVIDIDWMEFWQNALSCWVHCCYYRFGNSNNEKTNTIWSDFSFTFTSIWQVELNFNQTFDDVTKTFELYNHMIASNTFLRVLDEMAVCSREWSLSAYINTRVPYLSYK